MKDEDTSFGGSAPVGVPEIAQSSVHPSSFTLPPSAHRRLRRPQTSLAPYGFLLPFLAVFSLFFLYPLVQSVAMSVRAYAGPRVSRGVGFAQYQFILTDPLFWVAVANTVSYTILFLLF